MITYEKTRSSAHKAVANLSKLTYERKVNKTPKCRRSA